MKIKFNDLKKQWDIISQQSLINFNQLLEDSDFILGKWVSLFEKSFADYIGSLYSIGVSNGTDAIKIATSSIFDEKEEVSIFLPANTFIATLIGVRNALPNGEFILIDCDDFFQMNIKCLKELLNYRKNKKAFVVPVHLYGFCSNVLEIKKIADSIGAFVLEDSSQAHGAKVTQNLKAGNIGHIAAFSLYPGKNLGALGDAGIITTNNLEYMEKSQILRNLGSKQKYYHEAIGYNNRLDSIQAIFLNEKLKHLDEWNAARRNVASAYNSNIKNPLLTLPKNPEYCYEPIYHIYPILVSDREKFMTYLQFHQIPSIIHYPILIHQMNLFDIKFVNLSKSEMFAQQLVSLPIHPFLTKEEIWYIINIINNYR